MRLTYFPAVVLSVYLIACSWQCTNATDEAAPVAPAEAAKPICPI